MTIKFGLTMLILVSVVWLTACDAIKDTIKGDASTLGEIRIDDIDGQALEAVIKDSMSSNNITVNGNDVENIFEICCQYIRRSTYDENDIVIGGEILNGSNNSYVEVIHILRVYDHDDNVIATSRIQFTEERSLSWDFDLQPYQNYWYSVWFELDLADVKTATLTYVSSVKAE